jgi:hypothetical protein
MLGRFGYDIPFRGPNEWPMKAERDKKEINRPHPTTWQGSTKYGRAPGMHGSPSLCAEGHCPVYKLC